MLTRRSKAREVALQLLFQLDQNYGVEREVIETFAASRLSNLGLTEFGLELFDGVVDHRMEIDEQLAAAAENWRLSRMAIVDRNILRLAAFELMNLPANPPAVVINEAIELAKRFGSKDSPAFVNGILDRLVRDMTQPVKTEPLSENS